MSMDYRLQKVLKSLKTIRSVNDLESLSAGDVIKVNNSTHVVENYTGSQLRTYSRASFDKIQVSVFDSKELSIRSNSIIPASVDSCNFLPPGAGAEYKRRARRLREYGLMQ